MRYIARNGEIDEINRTFKQTMNVCGINKCLNKCSSDDENDVLTERPYLKAGIECFMISSNSDWGTASLPGHVALSSIPSNAEDRRTCSRITVQQVTFCLTLLKRFSRDILSTSISQDSGPEFFSF